MVSNPRGRQASKKDFRRTDNIFILRLLTDKQRQTRQKWKASKLCCCFVDFRKAFDTVPCAVLWQVLEKLGVCGTFLDVIKSLYACDSAAVRSLQGISAIFRCLTRVQQGCPLSPTLFGLYVDGLEQHLLETADIDAPTLMVVMVPLLLYANDLILMCESPAGLQKELDALASLYEQRQLQSASARQRWWCLRPNAAMYQIVYLIVRLSRGGQLQGFRLCVFMPRLGQRSWWKLPERHCLPCGGSVNCWGSVILLSSASSLTPWCYQY